MLGVGRLCQGCRESDWRVCVGHLVGVGRLAQDFRESDWRV